MDTIRADIAVNMHVVVMTFGLAEYKRSDLASSAGGDRVRLSGDLSWSNPIRNGSRGPDLCRPY